MRAEFHTRNWDRTEVRQKKLVWVAVELYTFGRVCQRQATGFETSVGTLTGGIGYIS